MPTETTNYNLKKPLLTEYYDVGIQNANMDIIDTEIKKNADAIAGAQDFLHTTANGYCSTGSNIAAKVEEGFITKNVVNGLVVSVYFVHSNTAPNPTIKINGVLSAVLDNAGTSQKYPDLNAGLHLFMYVETFSGWVLLDPKQSGLPIVESTDSNPTLKPNVYYQFGEVSNLAITLEEGVPGIVNEYWFEFISGSVPTTLAVPRTVRWYNGLNVEAGKTYICNISNGVGVMIGV